MEEPGLEQRIITHLEATRKRQRENAKWMAIASITLGVFLMLAVAREHNSLIFLAGSLIFQTGFFAMVWAIIW